MCIAPGRASGGRKSRKKDIENHVDFSNLAILSCRSFM